MKISLATVALTAFVAAQVSADGNFDDCARFINVFFDMEDYMHLTGTYVLAAGLGPKNNNPIYIREDENEYCLYAEAMLGMPGTRLHLGTCGSPVNDSATWTPMVADTSSSMADLCFPYNLAVTTERGFLIEEKSVHSMEYSTPAAPCSDCRNVLDGHLKGSYSLKAKYDGRCSLSTDQCLYSKDGEQDTEYCFTTNGEYETEFECIG